MATTKEYRDFILERLNMLEGITCRPMMGEYLLYKDGLLFGGIYDERLLIKKTDSLLANTLNDAIPYDGAKPMFIIENLDDDNLIRDVIIDTCEHLPKKK